MGDQGTTEKAFWSKEVADVLGISNSTIRKWALALEGGGYNFDRGANNSRVFYDKDMLVLRRLQELVQHKKMALDTSVNLVISSLEGFKRTEVVREENSDNSSVPQKITNSHEHVLLNEVLDRLDQMEDFNKQLLTELKKRDDYIHERLQKHEEHLQKRDEQIVTTLRETMETRKLIAASEEAKKEEKKGFFQRLFGK